MRKLLIVALAALLALALIPGSATAQKKGKGKKQEVEGTIALPARHPDGCYTGLSRHLWSLFGEASRGVLGYVFDVDKKTWKKPFVLEVTGGAGYIDLDLTYYLLDFATQEEFLNDPLPAAGPTVGFEEKMEGGEFGKVPEQAVKAIACIYASEDGTGLGAEFKYTAGRGVKLPKN